MLTFTINVLFISSSSFFFLHCTALLHCILVYWVHKIVFFFILDNAKQVRRKECYYVTQVVEKIDDDVLWDMTRNNFVYRWMKINKEMNPFHEHLNNFESKRYFKWNKKKYLKSFGRSSTDTFPLSKRIYFFDIQSQRSRKVYFICTVVVCKKKFLLLLHYTFNLYIFTKLLLIHFK